MSQLKFKIEIKCLFCDAVLSGKANKKYESGDMLKCQNCQELNDYDSLLSVVEEEEAEAEERIAKHLDEVISKRFSK